MAATPCTERETRTETGTVKVEAPAEAEAETSQTQQPSSSLLPLSRNLHLPPRWNVRWTRKEKGRENEQQQSEIGQGESERVGQQRAVVEEGEEEEEEANEESIIIRRDSRSRRSSGSVSYPYAIDSDDGSARSNNVWRRIRRFLPFGGFARTIHMIAYHHILMAINTVAMVMLCK
jgi:hypothetical protein